MAFNESKEISDDNGDAVEEEMEPQRPSPTVTPEEVVRGDNISQTIENTLEDDVDRVRSRGSIAGAKRKYGSGVGDKGMRETKKARGVPHVVKESSDENVVRYLCGVLESIGPTPLTAHGVG